MMLAMSSSDIIRGPLLLDGVLGEEIVDSSDLLGVPLVDALLDTFDFVGLVSDTLDCVLDTFDLDALDSVDFD